MPITDDDLAVMVQAADHAVGRHLSVWPWHGRYADDLRQGALVSCWQRYRQYDPRRGRLWPFLRLAAMKGVSRELQRQDIRARMRFSKEFAKRPFPLPTIRTLSAIPRREWAEAERRLVYSE